MAILKNGGLSILMLRLFKKILKISKFEDISQAVSTVCIR